MSTTSPPASPEPLRARLSNADDRIRLNHWMRPQQGIFPRIRIGDRWVNTLWALPIGAAALLCLIALAQSLRELSAVTARSSGATPASRNRRRRSTRAFPGGCSSSTF
jgi:methionine sulfoxide reductase catalytic subunit